MVIGHKRLANHLFLPSRELLHWIPQLVNGGGGGGQRSVLEYQPRFSELGEGTGADILNKSCKFAIYSFYVVPPH